LSILVNLVPDNFILAVAAEQLVLCSHN